VLRAATAVILEGNPEETIMSSVFSKIIAGELPGRFVWRDPDVAAFLTINPIRPGHTLVVPIREVDHWTDLDPELMARLSGVAQAVGKAQMEAFQPTRVGLMIAGLEVPHVHLHVIPIHRLQDMDFANADPSPRAEDLDAAADAIRRKLRALGYEQVTD
jgi:diadenosine tetraphosphate (Ap4A) HIT family hydrolase